MSPQSWVAFSLLTFILSIGSGFLYFFKSKKPQVENGSTFTQKVDISE